MRFGLVCTAASAKETVKLAADAEDGGFDSAAWGDHWMGLFPPSVAATEHGGAPDRWYHVLVMLAAAAEHTARIRLTIGVTDLLRRHPADLAQAFLTLAELYSGRDLVLGVGLGEVENLSPFGLEYHQRVDRLREGLQVLRYLLNDGHIDSFEGGYFRLHDAALEPRRTTAKVKLWLAAHGPRMLELCGQVADGWYPLASSPRRYRASLDVIEDAARRAGRDPRGIEAGLAINVCVTDSASDEAAACEDPVLRGFTLWSGRSLFTAAGLDGHPLQGVTDGFRDYVPSRITAAEYSAAVAAVPSAAVRRAVVIGNPDRICELLSRFEEAGAQAIFLWDVNRMRGLSGRESEIVQRYNSAR